MASATADLPLDSGGGESCKNFRRFPDLPPELRIRIWQMAYDSIPNIYVYRFELQFFLVPDSQVSDNGGEKVVPHAYLTPLKEVGHLTRELRSLRRVNTESRYEGGRLFDSELRFNQTGEGGTTDICPPINLPWKKDQNIFCFTHLTESGLYCLSQANTNLIDQVLDTVELLGIGINRRMESGLAESEFYIGFAEFILMFPEIEHVALVSDLLMSEADLDNIDNDTRSIYPLSCWDDWVGRVHERLISYPVEQPKIVNVEEHLMVLNEFAGSMQYYSDTHSETADILWEVTYGMVFRTKEDFGYLLVDDEFFRDMELSDHLFSSDMSEEGSEGFSEAFSDEFSAVDEDI